MAVGTGPGVGWHRAHSSMGTGTAWCLLPGQRDGCDRRAVVRHWARTVVTGPARRLLPGPRVCWHCARATVGTGFSRAGIVVRRPGPVKRADSILPAGYQPHEPSTLAARRSSRWQPLAEWAAARAHTHKGESQLQCNLGCDMQQYVVHVRDRLRQGHPRAHKHTLPHP